MDFKPTKKKLFIIFAMLSAFVVIDIVVNVLLELL